VDEMITSAGVCRRATRELLGYLKMIDRAGRKPETNSAPKICSDFDYVPEVNFENKLLV
jgi:hypothetical protein